MTLFLEDSETSVFENFIATDAPQDFLKAIMQLIENDDFPQNKLNKKLHFSFSTSNIRIVCINTINTINEAQYPWLQFESLEYEKSDYNDTYPASFAEGLKYIYSTD